MPTITIGANIVEVHVFLAPSFNPHVLCRVGQETRLMHWRGSSMADLHRAVRRLYQLTDVSAFTRPDLDMGLHIVSLLDTGAPSCEHHVRSIDQLHPGCVLEVRSSSLAADQAWDRLCKAALLGCGDRSLQPV